MIINLICLIAIHTGQATDLTFLEGQVVDQTEQQYVMDFSKDATAKKLIGDYSQVYVYKEECGPATKRIVI